MKKSLLYGVMALLVACAMPLGFVGCGTTPLPANATPEQAAAAAKQDVIDSLYKSYKTLDVAIDGTLALLNAGKLKTAEARKALDGYKAAKVGLDASMRSLGTAPPPDPAASTPK